MGEGVGRGFILFDSVLVYADFVREVVGVHDVVDEIMLEIKRGYDCLSVSAWNYRTMG